jgi:2-C-methyl-D-erythritol 2,4-cyclodiphosphate synthase
MAPAAHQGGGTVRVGIGYDIHRLGAERPLVLAGVTFDGEPGLIGHSDADAVLHAVADAVLGAAALGDLGERFPDTDARWKDCDSSLILEEVLRLAAEQRGLRLANLDVNVIAQKPRLAERKPAMRRRLAEVTGLPLDCVGLKARTAEGLGAVGRGEAIEVQAIVLMAGEDD